jgi:CBS domain-containing protein
MIEKNISHIPIMADKKIVGIITKTDLTRFQADTSANLVYEITNSNTIAELKNTASRIPQLLVNLVGSGNRHDIVTRLITDIGDTITRKLLKIAEDKLGAPPVPYLWLACGSQGRQEQTGISDQDNCLILDDSIQEADLTYFEKLAQLVSDGLNECGYYYCPGDMMATNPRWRQPLSLWRGYFKKWITNPDKEAQMLASVMFDLRPIGGTTSLFENLQEEVLEKASQNSIFTAHMISNSITHIPPLGLLRGFATLKSGEHKHHIDMKHNGVIPIVDLGRIYALQHQLKQVNTRARLIAAIDTGVISKSGGNDLLDAYDLIAETRLRHQARQINNGKKPDNYMRPTVLSEFERSHLRNAFVVVRTMQAAITQGQGIL